MGVGGKWKIEVGMVEPRSTAATSNGPSGNLSIKILLNYKDAQETNSNSQSRPNKKKRKEDEKKSQRALQMLEGFPGPPLFLTNWGDIATCSTPLRKIHHHPPIVFQCNLATFNVSWRVFISLPTNRSICQQVEC